MRDVLIGKVSTGYCSKGCKAIADSVTSLLTGSIAIVAEINAQIGGTGAVGQECKILVSQFEPRIIDLLITETDPSQICSRIGVCSEIATKNTIEEPCRILSDVFMEYTILYSTMKTRQLDLERQHKHIEKEIGSAR